MADESQVKSLSSIMSPAPTATTPAPQTQSSDLDRFFDQLKGQLVAQSGIVSSGSPTVEDQIKKAMESVTTGSEAATKSIEAQYAQREDVQTRANARTLASAQESQRGFATNTALLSQINEEGKKAINDLETQKQQLILAGRADAAAKLADLQVTQAQMQLQNRQAIFSNLVAIAGVAGQQGQLQLSREQLNMQQKQAEAEIQSKMGDIALRYGVKVSKGDSISDVVNRASGNAKALYDLDLQDKAASLKLKGAQTALANAQASAARNKTVSDFGGFWDAINTLPGGVQSDGAKIYMAGMVSSLANNPSSMQSFVQSYAKAVQSRNYPKSSLVQQALTARSMGLEFDDYIGKIDNNSSIQNKDEAKEIARNIFGVQDIPSTTSLFLQSLVQSPFINQQFSAPGVAGFGSRF